MALSKQQQEALHSMLLSEGWVAFRLIMQDRIDGKTVSILSGVDENKYQYLIGMVRAFKESMSIPETTLETNIERS